MTYLPKDLKSFLLHFAKPYKKWLIIIIITEMSWPFDAVVRPYLLKYVIDTVALNYNNSNLTNLLLPSIIGYVLMLILVNVAFRIWEYGWYFKVGPSIKSSIYTCVFKYLELHSYEYFQNNFAGALSQKVSDLASGCEKIFKSVTSLGINILSIILTMMAIFTVHPAFTLVILLWSIAALFIMLKYSELSKPLSKNFSESKSRLSGKIIDSGTVAR